MTLGSLVSVRWRHKVPTVTPFLVLAALGAALSLMINIDDTKYGAVETIFMFQCIACGALPGYVGGSIPSLAFENTSLGVGVACIVIAKTCVSLDN